MSDTMDDAMRIWEETAGVAEAGPHQDIVAQGRQLLRSSGEDRRDNADDALTLYHGSSRYSFTSSQTNQILPDLEPTGYNVIRACVDTLTNTIVRNKVRPMFVTERGDSQLKEKAQGMQRVVETVFMDAGIWGALGAQVCRHGNMFEGGGVKIFPDYANHKVGMEILPAHEFLISPLEAKDGNPRQAWMVQIVPREQLAAQFKDDEAAQKAIAAAQPATGYSSDRGYADADRIADMIEVWEYWHLPSCYVDRKKKAAWGKNSAGERDHDVDPEHDGRHCICLEGFTLLDDPWPFDYFPVAWYRPARTAVGYWSVGLPERLAPAQILLNRLNDRIDKIIHMHAVPKMVVWDQAKINPAKLTNGVADIITSKIQPSQAVYYLTPQAVPSELFNRQAAIISWAKEETGLSEMSMSAQKPAGVDHEPGMQFLADSESVRHTIPFREWEDFGVSAARIVVDVCRMLAEYDSDFSVMFADSKQLKHIKWKDVDVENEKWHLRCWPTNLLPQTPGARMSRAMMLYQSGFWTKDQTALALDFPDIESISGDTTAALENIERMVTAAVNGDDGAVPEPYMNLQLASVTLVNKINRMQADGEDPETVERVRQLWSQTDELIKRMTPPAPAMPPAPGPAAMPPGPPPGAAPAA